MPVSFRQAFAAGAASAAAQQDGQAEPEQLKKAQVATLMVDELDAKKAGESSVAKLSATRPANPLEPPARARGEASRPTEPPGPGLLLRLAQFLGLK